ncbi:MAG: TIGR04282 family arsenosugar biosynthesis glycosyltransferase [Bradyrhizobiaceae bacterium]|nr:TIGR04282 family arsenosugar biosynthesis glycosyltransferase [Bradyrhizobiaceae bacterium]
MATVQRALEPIAIAVLSKAPGSAKTRLRPVLGAEGAAALQTRLIARTLETALAAGTGPVTLWAAPDETHPAFRTLVLRPGLALARQPEGDLGRRMEVALASACPALVIGTDCPALAPNHLRDAAEVLRSGIDVVLIPVDDGGYALIGARNPHSQLFTDMAWGTATIMADTRRRMTDLGLSWRELEQLWDVDVPADLERLRREGFAYLMD